MNTDMTTPAAAHLLALRETGRCGARLAESYRPRSLEAAWQIQRRVSEERATRCGIHVAGWKCGLPGPEKWVVAPIYSDLLVDAAVGVPSSENPIHMEPEFAFRIGRNLPARVYDYRDDTIDDAVDAVHLAIEIVGSRYADASHASFAELLADGLMNRGLLIGPQVYGIPLEPAFPLGFEVEGGRRIDLTARHGDGNPRLALYWLANFLRSRGIGLEAGQWVITGSLAGVLELPASRGATLRFGPFGEIRLPGLYTSEADHAVTQKRSLP